MILYIDYIYEWILPGYHIKDIPGTFPLVWEDISDSSLFKKILSHFSNICFGPFCGERNFCTVILLICKKAKLYVTRPLFISFLYIYYTSWEQK